MESLDIVAGFAAQSAHPWVMAGGYTWQISRATSEYVEKGMNWTARKIVDGAKSFKEDINREFVRPYIYYNNNPSAFVKDLFWPAFQFM